MEYIEFSAFQNICRTCMSTSDLLLIQSNNISEVLQFLSGTRYSKTDEFPQKLCINCFETMKQIQLFAFKCHQTQLNLTKSLFNFKNNMNQANNVEFVEIKQEFTEETDPNNLELVTEHLVKDELLFKKVTKQEIEITSEQSSTSDNTLNQIEIDAKQKNDPFECDVCTKTFKTKNILWHHKKVHSNERRFECNICLKRFKRSGHLIRHKRIHSGERPHKCEVCNKTFTLKSTLVTHRAIHSEVRRFECDMCMMSFKQSSHLTGHKRIHTGERPYQCDVCNKWFSHKSHLVRHKMIHIGKDLLRMG